MQQEKHLKGKYQLKNILVLLEIKVLLNNNQVYFQHNQLICLLNLIKVLLNNQLKNQLDQELKHKVQIILIIEKKI